MVDAPRLDAYHFHEREWDDYDDLKASFEWEIPETFNMATYACPHCGEEEALFPTGEVDALAAAHDVPYLGRLPFDPRLARAADAGTLFAQQHPDAPAARAFRRLAAQVRAFVE